MVFLGELDDNIDLRTGRSLKQGTEYVHAYSGEFAPVTVSLDGDKYLMPVALCGMYNVVFALAEQKLFVTCPDCLKELGEKGRR